MKKIFDSLKISFNSLANMERELNSKKEKKQHSKITNNFKKNFDKLYFLSYYDVKFKIPNYNKLALDIENTDESIRLIVVNIKGLLDLYYQNKEKPAESLINEIKEIAKAEKYKNVYLVDGFLVLIANKKEATKIYYKVKECKKGYSLNVCFVKYRRESGKIQKNLHKALCEANKIFNGNEENGLDEED